MFGRGSRSFGVSRGMYFTWKFPASALMEDQLASLEPDFEDGHKILEKIYKAWKNLTPTQKEAHFKNLDKKAWQTSIYNFQKKYTMVWNVLSGVKDNQPRPDLTAILSQKIGKESEAD